MIPIPGMPTAMSNMIPTGYTSGPPGSSGGLTRQQSNPYGYGQAPGQSGLGYYEQQTPVGSFAAAEWGGPVQQQFARQQFGQAQTAGNPYIGQTSQGIGAQGSVLPYAQQVAAQAQQANPYLGGQSAQAQQVGANPFGGGNPYLQQQIDATTQDATRAWQNAMNPQFDRAAQASGSFGNTAIEQQRQQAMGDWGKNLANAIGGMRMQDYTQQQQLAENALNRQQSTNQFNAGLGAGDLNRNMAGFYQGQGLGLQGLNSLLGAAQFDAGLGNNVNQFNAQLGASDLGRNAQLAQGMGQFNAGQLSGMSQFNAGQGNALGQFNAGQGNALGQFGAGQRQATNLFNAGAANGMLENSRNRDLSYAGLDWNIDQGNWQRQQQGLNNALNIYDRMLGYTDQGNALGTQMQNTPLNYWQQFANTGQGLAGLGASSTQNMQGNPWLGALAGWMSGNQLFGGGR